MSIRRLNRIANLLIPNSSELNLLDGSGADQCIVNLYSFLVSTRTGVFYDVGGATGEMVTLSPLELVNKAYTLCTLPDNKKKVIFCVNQAFCNQDSNQKEALLATHQLHDFSTIVDNCAKRHLTNNDGTKGSQSITSLEGEKCEFHFDRKKCYFSI